MLCQDCKKRQAEVHLTQIVNNQKVTLALCKECAEARGFHSPLDNVPFPLAEILSGLAGTDLQAAGKDKETGEELTCGKCGLTFSQFTRQGRFGCGECYAAFRTRLEPIMRKIHGASLHRGRHPEVSVVEGAEAPTLPIKEEERLETDLRKAVQNEDFERAAEIRDMLKDLREHADADATSKG